MTDQTDDTTPKQRTGGITGKGFVKGDKRINRKGRPKSFDQLRALAQSIAALPLSDEEKTTRIEAMLKLMSSSRNPADRRLFLEYAFGKPKEEIEIDNKGKLIIEIVRASDDKGADSD